MSKNDEKENLNEPEIVQRWLAAKTDDPLLEKAEFAAAIGVGVRVVERILKPVFKQESQIIGRFIADDIRKCSESLGVEPVDLTWHQYRRYIGMAWGQNKNGIQPYHITQVGGFNRIRDAFLPPGTATRQQVEKLQLATYAMHNRRFTSALAEEQLFQDNLESFVKQTFGGLAKARAPAPKKVGDTKRVVTVVLSDLHIGSDILAKKTGILDYGKIEESRRLAKIAYEVVNYKPQYRQQTALNVLLLGDIIQGHLHNPRDAADSAEQFSRALRCLVQFMTYVAANYSDITVYCATGNHGRDKAMHFDRATSRKYDSHETKIYVALAEACRNLSNVRFVIPQTPYVTYECLGSRFYATHGDTVINPGNPGKAIPTGSLENQTNRLNASLHNDDKYAVFVVGHVHLGSQTHLNNGAVMLTNGALCPPDDFAVSINIPQANCGQWLFESVHGYPIGDTRFIRVDANTDKDSKLDEIIAPWQAYGQI